MELKRVVVTGLGAITPLGNSVEETWKGLVAGKSGAAPITLFDATDFKTQFACEVKGFNIKDYLDRKAARNLDRYTELAMASAIQGVQDAKIDLDTEDLNRVGVIYGVGIGGIKTFEDEVMYYGQHIDKGPQFSPFFIPKMISDIASGQIAIHLVSMDPTSRRHQLVLLLPMHWVRRSISCVWARPILLLPVVLRLLSVLVA